jgi:hypothetical protein
MIFDEGNSSDRIIQAVDEGLMSLGSSARRVIYYILDRRFQLRPEGIPENLQLSHNALQALPGEGAKVAEKTIAISLYKSLGLSLEEHSDWTLVDYVNHANKIVRDSK